METTSNNLSNDTIEANRLEDYDKCLDAWGENLLERFKPGSFGHHEAVHVAMMMFENVDHYLLQHPAIVSDSDLYRRVSIITNDLIEVYEKLSTKQDEVNEESC